MNKFFRAVIAGVAAKRYGNNCLGGGCLGAIAVSCFQIWVTQGSKS